MLRELLLTDDEVVAVAVQRGSYWPSELPTVDGQDAAELTAAMRRGRRSLLVRGLLSVDVAPSGSGQAVLDPALDLLASIPGRGSWVRLYAGNSGLVREGFEFLSYFYPLHSGQWCVEGVGPEGLRTISLASQDEVTALWEGLFRAVFENGLEGGEGGRGRCLCAAAGDSRSAAIVAVAKGAARSAEVHAGNGPPAGIATTDLPDAAAAIELLLRQVGARVAATV